MGYRRGTVGTAWDPFIFLKRLESGREDWDGWDGFLGVGKLSLAWQPLRSSGAERLPELMPSKHRSSILVLLSLQDNLEVAFANICFLDLLCPSSNPRKHGPFWLWRRGMAATLTQATAFMIHRSREEQQAGPGPGAHLGLGLLLQFPGRALVGNVGTAIVWPITWFCSASLDGWVITSSFALPNVVTSLYNPHFFSPHFCSVRCAPRPNTHTCLLLPL